MATTGSTLFQAFFDQITGVASVDYGALIAGYGEASGIVYGNNPSFTLSDFLDQHPKFFGAPSAFVATAAISSSSLSLTDATGVAAGQFIAGSGIPRGTLILSVSGTTITISSQTTAVLTSESISIYTLPIMPIIVTQMYINLATASLQQVQYGAQMWPMVMGLYIAHYCTLYLQTDNSPAGASAASIAAQGLAGGIQVSKAVGDVSVSYQPLRALENWGAFNLTKYGLQFASIARAIFSGPIGVR